MPHADRDPSTFRYKPTRADTASINGALSRGPTTEAGKRRSSANSLTHGLRARRHLAVPALGEDPDEAEAHFAAVRAELGAAGLVARHLAEATASVMLRAARTDRIEGELLAGLAEGGRSIVEALHADRDARATLALFQRYHHEADGEVRRSLDTLVRLHRVRTEGLLPDGEEAERAQAESDEALAELPAPSEPKIARVVPTQRLAGLANDDAAPPRAAAAGAAPGAVVPSTPSPAPTGAALLRQYRWFRSEPERARMWRQINLAQRADVLAAAGAGHLDAAVRYDTLRPLLVGTASIVA